MIGGAACVREDLVAFAQMPCDREPVFIAVNRAGCDFRRVDHWVTLHPEKLKDWKALRTRNGHPHHYETWSRRRPDLVDHHLDNWGAGSGGLYGVIVALHNGLNRIVLFGVPMTPTPHYHDSEQWSGGDWGDADLHWEGWERNEHRLQGKVRSMSGRTREMLGCPDEEWLRGNDGD